MNKIMLIILFLICLVHSSELKINPVIFDGQKIHIQNMSDETVELKHIVLSGDLYAHRAMVLKVSIGSEDTISKPILEFVDNNKSNPENPDFFHYNFATENFSDVFIKNNDSLQLNIELFDMCQSCGMYLAEAIFALDFIFSNNKMVTLILRHKDPSPNLTSTTLPKKTINFIPDNRMNNYKLNGARLDK